MKISTAISPFVRGCQARQPSVLLGGAEKRNLPPQYPPRSTRRFRSADPVDHQRDVIPGPAKQHQQCITGFKQSELRKVNGSQSRLSDVRFHCRRTNTGNLIQRVGQHSDPPSSDLRPTGLLNLLKAESIGTLPGNLRCLWLSHTRGLSSGHQLARRIWELSPLGAGRRASP
jgi:hypothetical protein